MNRSTKIWLVLVFFTALSLFLGAADSFTYVFLAIVLFITFIKGQLVIDYFMGLKDVKLKYRLIVSMWLFFIITLIGMAYAIPIKG